MLQRWLKKYGHFPTVIVSTLSIGTASLALTVLINLLLGLELLPSGLVISFLLPLAIAGPILHVISRTLAELAKTKAQMERMATTDMLTEVNNRRQFITLAEEALLNANEAQPVGMVIFDIDRFKLINDTYGHLEGDEALRLIAQTVRVQLREGDIFGRFGGDEFILLAPNTSAREIQSLCHILLNQVQTLSVGNRDMHTRLSATMGVTAAVPSAVSLNDLIARADSALLQAKREGGGKVRYV
jgi:diguanylate cyclase (GGDEF)-like protein